MILPTTDYTPLRQAKSQLTQAKRSQFIAPQIEYQTKSLQLQEKGVERSISHINTQKDINTLSFMYETAKTMVEAAFAAGKGAQMAKAQSMGNGMANAYNNKISEMVSNGQMYVSTHTDQDPTDAEGGVTSAYIVGMDKLQDFQNQQIQQIESQNWFPSVKNQTIAAMQGIYSNGQAKILQDYYANETKARFQLEQQNLADAIDMDIASGTLSSPSYTNTMATIANMNRGPNASALLARTSVQDIDLGVAANSVREAAVSRGNLAGIELANQISDTRGYNADTRRKLESYANQAAHQAELNAQNAGTQFMTDQIASGVIGADAWERVREYTKEMPQGQKEAFERAAENVHMKQLVDLNSKALSGLDSMSPDDISLAIDELDKNRIVYEGTPATLDKYFGLKDAYQKRLRDYGVAEEKLNKELTEAEKNAIKEYKSNQLALLDTLIPDWEAGLLTGQEVVNNCEDAMRNANKANGLSDYYTDADEANLHETAQKIINTVKGKLPPTKRQIFNEHYDDIQSTIMEFWFKEDNKDNLTAGQKDIISENQKWLEGKMIDMCYKNEISDERFEKELKENINQYQINLYSEFNKDLIVNTNNTKEEAAMARTEAFQTKGQVYYNSSTGNFSFPPGISEQYDNSAQIEKNMIRENYGIDVEDNYSIKDLNGNAVPVFQTKGNGPYITVYNGQVYKWYSHGQMIPVARTKEFTKDGYEDIEGVSRMLLSDPNLNRPVISSTTKDTYQQSAGGR